MDAVAEIQEPELVREDADAADEKAAAPADGRNDTDPSWAHLLEPAPRHRGGEPQKHDGDREHPDDLAQGPVVRGAGHHTEDPGQWRG